MITADAVSVRRIAWEIWRPLTFYVVWNIAVTVVWAWTGFTTPDLPLPLVGSALGLFLGFGVNAAYGRWWEARTLWGAMINASRSLAREVCAGFPDPRDARYRDRTIHAHIAFVHALRCQLRGTSTEDEIVRVLGKGDAAAVREWANPANALAHRIGENIGHAVAEGRIDPMRAASINHVLRDISNAQGGMERIRNTPLPVQYRLLPDLFTRLFCLAIPFGLLGTLGYATPIAASIVGVIFLSILRVGVDLAEPFANGPHDVPMTAMTRTIEIDLRNILGEPAPEPVRPVRSVLS